MSAALDLLNDRLCIADSIGQALAAAAGEDGSSPAWVDVYRRQVETIREAAEALEVSRFGVASHERPSARGKAKHASSGRPRGDPCATHCASSCHRCPAKRCRALQRRLYAASTWRVL